MLCGLPLGPVVGCYRVLDVKTMGYRRFYAMLIFLLNSSLEVELLEIH
jgi:hypothetical protein